MGSDGNYHVILNQAYPITPTTVKMGQPFKFGSYNIPASGISQYNTASGISSSIIDFSNQPNLVIYTNFPDSSYGAPQKSTWSNWADIRWTATVKNASPTPTTQLTTQQLINRAVQEFDEYQKLTAAGRLAEAGKKLEEHKRTLEELKRAAGKP